MSPQERVRKVAAVSWQGGASDYTWKEWFDYTDANGGRWVEVISPYPPEKTETPLAIASDPSRIVYGERLQE